MAKYFGTNGIRGRLDELTPELAIRVSKAFGAWCKGKTILVGRDARVTGEMLRNAVCAGLSSAGCDVVDLGIVPAPTVELMVKLMGADGAITITASHNPPEWNALKFVDKNSIAVSKERGEEIEKLMEKEILKGWDKVGRIMKDETAIRKHSDEIKKRVDVGKIRKRKLKVVLDCGNGTAALIAPSLFKEMGCEIITLNDNMDGHFPGRVSEPTRENLGDLIRAVPALGADMGIAWDMDGDRVIFIDEKGNWIVGDKSFALSTLLMLRKKKGTVVTTVATSKAVEDVCRKEGVEIVYTKVGAPYLAEKVKEENAVIGGEEVGGVIWPELSYGKDGFMTAAKIAEAICEKPLGEWLKEITPYYNAKCKITCGEEDKKKVISGIRKFAEKEKYDIITLDGVRVNMKNEWVIVRASGTENYVRVFAEAKTEKRAKELMEEYEKRVRRMIK